jgi:hypothetical protein
MTFMERQLDKKYVLTDNCPEITMWQQVTTIGFSMTSDTVTNVIVLNNYLVHAIQNLVRCQQGIPF